MTTSAAIRPEPKPFHVRLPATSANLGPGFDALGLAMALYLTIDATAAESFHIDATGRDAGLCSALEDNLILTTYMDVLTNAGIPAPRLHLKLTQRDPSRYGLRIECRRSPGRHPAGESLR